LLSDGIVTFTGSNVRSTLVSAEVEKAALQQTWRHWEGQVVNAVYPLRRFLGASAQSVVYLTESAQEGFLNAAIKIVPAHPQHAMTQLGNWKAAATLRHPHLIRILEVGRCQIEAQEYLFAVMEYAEETLAEILPYRALEADEIREMLSPTLDALGFLHRDRLAQGQLKPSNFLVVNDQLKLASDTIRHTSDALLRAEPPSRYDPPEAREGMISTAGDIWALGVTLVEALTQYPPTGTEEGTARVQLPAAVPLELANTIRRCLNRQPADRPTVADLEAQLKGPPPVAAAPLSELTATNATDLGTYIRQPSNSRWLLPVVAAVVLLSVLVGLVGWHLLPGHSQAQSRENKPPQAAVLTPTPATVAAAPVTPAVVTPPAHPITPAVVTPPAHPIAPAGESAVLHQEIPNVSRASRETIHGRIKVVVRATVDREGNVVRQALEYPGPSKYFARVASTAAQKWKFSSAAGTATGEWRIEFGFNRWGTTAHASPLRGERPTVE
jgi:serine/threonine protein kinase